MILIVLAKRMGAQDAQVGLIFSIAGVGGILGSMIGGPIQRRFSFGRVIASTVGAGAVIPALHFGAYFILLGVITAVIYVTIPIFNVLQFSYRIALIPDELQGRVNSTFRLIAYGLQPLGAALSGVLLDAPAPPPR